MNTRKILSRMFIFGFSMLVLFSMGTTAVGAQQSFNNAEDLVTSLIPRGFHDLIISDKSEEVNKIIRELTQGKYPDDRVVVWDHISSQKPITTNDKRFARRAIDVELANAIVTAVLTEYEEELAKLFASTDEAAVMKIISYTASMAVLQSRKTELELTFSAGHPDGREVYGWLGFISTKIPGIEAIVDAANSSGWRGASFSSGPEPRRQAGTSETINLVNEILDNDAGIRKFREFFDRLRYSD